MTVRWRKVLADIRVRPARTLLAVVSLAVGVFAVGAIHLGTTEIVGSFDEAFAATNPPSAVMTIAPGFDERLVASAAALPEVGAAEGRRRLSARVRPAGGESSEVELVALGPDANRIARVDPRDGAWPPTPGQLVLERASLDDLGVEVGDRVEVRAPGAAPVQLTVAGSALDFYEIPPALGGVSRGYVDLATIERLTGSALLDTLLIRAADEPLDRDRAIAASATVRDRVVQPSGRTVERSAIGEPGQHRIAAVMAEQRRQLGVMKAIGGTSRQVAGLYLGYALVLELIALAVAVPASVLAGRAMASFFGSTLNYDLRPLQVPWTTLGVEVAVAILVPTAAVAWIVWRASRATVRETISDYGLAGGRVRAPTLGRLGRPTWLALRNGLRNRSRLVLTLTTLALSGTLLIGVLSVDRGLGQLVDRLMGYTAYDVELTLTEPVPFADVATVARSQEGVADVEGWLRRDAFRIRPDGGENEGIAVIGAPPDSPFLRPTLRGGRVVRAREPRALVVNEDLLREEEDLAVGELATLEIEGRRERWRIVGEVSTQLLGPVAYTTTRALGAASDRRGQTNLLAVGLADGADPDEVGRALERALLDAGAPVGGLETNASLRSQTEGIFTLLVVTLLSVTALILPIAIVSIAGTVTLGLIERTREIGVLRAIGASSRTIRRLLLTEGLAVAFAGGLAAVVLSVPAAWLLGRLFGEQFFQTPLPFAYSLPAVGIWLALTAVIGALGATRPARAASRLTIRETLSYE